MNKKGIATIGLIITILFSLPFASSAIVKMQTADQIYETVEAVPQKRVALVLGAAAYPSGLSDILADRVDTAIDLYQADKVEKLVMSGAQNEVDGMKAHAMGKNVPEADIISDPNGLNTLASVRNATGLKASMVIVTQQYHLPRALFIAGAEGIEAIGLIADRHEYLKIFEFKKRELLATSKAIFDIFLR